MVRLECKAVIGTIGNEDHENVKLGKAGRKRHMGIRPTVRGSVMNPVSYTHLAVPNRNNDIGEYHAATGLEALFGYLYLTGGTDRLAEFMKIIFGDTGP